MGLRAFRRIGPLVLGVVAVMVVVAAVGLVLTPTDPPPRLDVPSDGPPPGLWPNDPNPRSGVIGLDDRVPLQLFKLPGASDQGAVRHQLRATQTLSCDASASLVYRNDVIIFAAHQILRPDGSYRDDLWRCTFDVDRFIDGRHQVEHYPILFETLDNGPLVENGSEQPETWLRSNVDDWVIARLGRGVPDLAPYALPSAVDLSTSGQTNMPVATVSKATDDWPGDMQDFIAQNCRTIPSAPHVAAAYPAILHFDCDTNGGASGGAMLHDLGRGRLVYLAIAIGYSGGQCAVAGIDTCFMIGRRLDADLVARIKATTGRPPVEDEPLAVAQEAHLAARRSATTDAILAVLHKPFRASDETGKRAAELFKTIAEKMRAGDAAATAPLFREVENLLDGDDERTRPEWSILLRMEAASLVQQHRTNEAHAKYREARDWSPALLWPFFDLRLAQTEGDVSRRGGYLLRAYVLAGEKLFTSVGADKDLAVVKAIVAARMRGVTAAR